MSIAPETTALAALAIVFGTGFVSGLSPCSLPTALFVTSYVGGSGTDSRRRTVLLSTAFVAGIVVTLAALGAAAGALGQLLSYVRVVNYVVAAIMAITALWLLDVIDFGALLPARQYKRARGRGWIGAFFLGVPFALTASPCTFPVTLGVLAYVATRGDSGLGAGLMMAFAVGRSLPLWIVATSASMLIRMQRLARFQSAFEKIAGVVLIGITGWLLWTA